MGFVIVFFSCQPFSSDGTMKTLTSLLARLGTLSALLCTTSAYAVDLQSGNLDAAQKKVAMCIGCHGIPGYQASFPEVHKVPMIAGQSAGYIASALQAYRKGDRKHPTMRGIAGSLSDQDIADLAVYYEAQAKGVPGPAAQPAQPDSTVQALLTKGNCMACHGNGLNHPIDPSYPKLAGQHADYLFVALKAYGTAHNPQVGRSNPIMGGQVQAFQPTELKQLAQYIGSLPGDLRTVPQKRLR